MLAICLFWLWPVLAAAQSVPLLNMGYSGAGIGSDLLKVIERAGLWRRHGIDVRTIYLSSGSLMAQTMSSGDIGVAGFDTPAMLNLAVAGSNLKVVAVPINRIEPMFVVRSNIKVPGDLKGKRVTISRFGSGSDIMTRVALRHWKLDPEKDVSFLQTGNTPTRIAALVAGQVDAALVSSTGVAKIIATGCCRVLADLAELPLDFANYGVVVSGSLLKNQRDPIKGAGGASALGIVAGADGDGVTGCGGVDCGLDRREGGCRAVRLVVIDRMCRCVGARRHTQDPCADERR
jgi:ABC-type nitrate/sulfonate/bicarbonate transport system substrate-binding protein